MPITSTRPGTQKAAARDDGATPAASRRLAAVAKLGASERSRPSDERWSPNASPAAAAASSCSIVVNDTSTTDAGSEAVGGAAAIFAKFRAACAD